MENSKPLDQILYEAYCEKAGWKSAVTGADLPQYEQCPDAVKRCWRATADAAIEWADELENAHDPQATRQLLLNVVREHKENRILSGMNLIAKYEPDADIHAEEDQIWFGSYRPDLMTNQERVRMRSWGWIEHEESWSHFC